MALTDVAAAIRVVLDVVLLVAGGLLLVPGLVLLLETLAALLPARRAREEPAPPLPRVAVVVPAHDEAAQIEATVRSLAREVDGAQRILVVADNCRDETAARA